MIGKIAKKIIQRGIVTVNKPPQKKTVAALQICSKDDIEKNFQSIKSLAFKCREKGAEFIFLPENFAYIGPNPSNIAEPLNGPIIEKYAELAKELDIWMSLGGFQEKITDNNKTYITHIILDNKGRIVSVYRKIHLFDVFLGKGSASSESNFVIGGKEITPPIDTPIGKLGLSVCYDVRFPELYRKQFYAGAEILAIPSMFLTKTGAAHWEILARCRAIENECYVVAASQVGQHHEKRASYGHTVIVDPWGTIVGNEIGYAIGEIDLQHLKNIRKGLPCKQHLRRDLY